MNVHAMIALGIGLILAGCSPVEEEAAPMSISSILISVDDAGLTTKQRVVTNEVALAALDAFVSRHSSGWTITEETSLTPIDSVVIYKKSGEFFQFGYSENQLLKSKSGHDRYQSLDQQDAEKLQCILKDLRVNN